MATQRDSTATCSPGVGAAPPEIDWRLACGDVADGTLFLVGLVLVLVGLPALGLSLLAGCLWLDWQTLLHVRRKAEGECRPARRAALRAYVRFRVGSTGAAHVVLGVIGLYLALGGWLGFAAALWGVAAAGTLCKRALARVDLADVPPAGSGATAGGTPAAGMPLPPAASTRNCGRECKGGVGMKATMILKLEHREIEKVLAALEQACDHLEAGHSPPPLFFEQTMDFIRTFADRCHHRKEEDLLFARMVERGFPREGGPLAVMLEEHERGRALVARLTAAVAALAAGEDGVEATIVEAGRAYVALLAEHIRKEDHILYPIAESVLTAADDAELVRLFDEADEELGHKTHERYTHLAETLADQAHRAL
jgi:hemerythrin-like domain-containing protein